MQTIIKAHTSADFLAMVPTLVGFVPRNSIALVAFRGNRTHGVLRADVPKSATTAIIKRVASNLVGTMCKIHDVQAIAIVIFTNESATERLPHVELATVLGRRIEQSGFRVHDSLCQARDGWFSYLDEQPTVHPLAEVIESACKSEVPEDRQPQAEFAARVADADEVTMTRVRKKLDRIHTASHSKIAAIVDREFAAVEDFPLFVENALHWSPEELASNDALFIWSILSPPMRDMVMLQWATDLKTGDRLYDESDVPIDQYDPSLAHLLMGVGERPDRERVESAIRLMQKIVARCDDMFRPAPLCMLAWLNWAIGQSSIARMHVLEAQAIDPEYGMAELLDTMLFNGMFPEWAFDE